MPERIPIKAAKAFAASQGLKQLIIAAWDGARTHVVTYGVSVKDCDQAAQGGNLIKQAMGWAEDKCNTDPNRVRKLKAQVKELEQRLSVRDGCALMVNRNLAAQVRHLESLLELKGTPHQ